MQYAMHVKNSIMSHFRF